MKGIRLDRTSKDRWYLDVAYRTAAQSTCRLRKYGAVIVDEAGDIISTGYNGAPRGAPHCTELGTCIREKRGVKPGTMYEFCIAVHAEQNAMLQAGKKSRGASMYVDGFDANTGELVCALPCFLCVKMALNAGIKEIVYRTDENLVRKISPIVLYDSEYAKMEK